MWGSHKLGLSTHLCEYLDIYVCFGCDSRLEASVEEFDTAFLLGPVCWGIKREEKKDGVWCLGCNVFVLLIWGRTKEPT